MLGMMVGGGGLGVGGAQKQHTDTAVWLYSTAGVAGITPGSEVQLRLPCVWTVTSQHHVDMLSYCVKHTSNHDGRWSSRLHDLQCPTPTWTTQESPKDRYTLLVLSPLPPSLTWDRYTLLVLSPLPPVSPGTGTQALNPPGLLRRLQATALEIKG